MIRKRAFCSVAFFLASATACDSDGLGPEERANADFGEESGRDGACSAHQAGETLSEECRDWMVSECALRDVSECPEVPYIITDQGEVGCFVVAACADRQPSVCAAGLHAGDAPSRSFFVDGELSNFLCTDSGRYLMPS